MTSDVNVRQLVLEILLAVTRDGQYCHIVLNHTLDKYQYLTKQERSFVTRVCEGTLENMIWIDYVLNQVSSVKVNKMKPAIRCILRSAVYELKYMDSVPPQATCNEAVKLAQKKGFHTLKGFVNGVLRNVSRRMEEISLPDREKEPISYLSVCYSMPEWIVKEWTACYGIDQTEEILKAFLEQTPTSIRVNVARISKKELLERLKQEGVTVTENPLVQEGLYLSGYDYLQKIPSFSEGLFYVQDVTSMLAVHAATIKKGDHVIDVCAAPGGKSIHAAELLGQTGMVEARDLTESKVDLIQENIDRCQLSNIRAKQADATIFYPDDQETADVVIADLPCSGLGVIGKKPDIKYRMTKEQQRELAVLQQEILHTVAAYVKPQGTLLYSTCTICRMENEENVRWFLEKHPEFELEEEKQLLPRAGVCDGFFYARLKKSKGHS